MGISIVPSQLKSRAIKINSMNGVSGLSILDPDAAYTNTSANQVITKKKISLSFFTKDTGSLGEKAVNFLFKFGRQLIGFAFKAIDSLVWSATTLFALAVQTGMAIWNFDWNASDEELWASCKQDNIRLAGLWGGVFGKITGWAGSLALGYGFSLFIPVIGGKLLAQVVASRVGQEATEEIIPSVLHAIGETIKSLAKKGAIWVYTTGRRIITQKDWSKRQGPNASFAYQFNQKIESIKDPALQNFVEEFFEEAWESFVEGGYVAASAIDEFIANRKEQQNAVLGEERSLIIKPDANNDDEQIILHNVPQELAIAQTQQILNTHRLIHNRDVGQIVGYPMKENLKGQPKTLRIIITMMSVSNPPYQARVGQKKLVRVAIEIPDFKKTKLDWDDIKEACGGKKGYNWGRFRATANLSNNRQMVVYGGTAKEAEEQLKKFIALSSADLVTLSITEEKKEGVRLTKPQLQKETTRVYPAFFTVINRIEMTGKETDKEKEGKAKLIGKNFTDRRARIDLWTETKPANFNETINYLLNEKLKK